MTRLMTRLARRRGLSLLVIAAALASGGCGENEKPARDKAGAAAPATGEAAQATGKPAPAEEAIDQVELPADDEAVLPLGARVRKIVLDNGLTVFLRKNEKPEKRVQFRLVVDAGSYYEDDDQRGLAHFLEHMAFNGTRSFPKNDLVHELQKLGAKFGPHINAMTSFDETIYQLEVPSDDPRSVSTALQILREWASDITIDPKDVDAERGVVLAEKRNGAGVQERLTEKLVDAVFSGGRYSKRLPIGKPTILKTASAAQIRRFYEDWYRPEHMAVIAVGDLDPTAMEKDLRERFGSLPRAEKGREPIPRAVPRRKKREVLVIEDEEMPVSAVVVGHLLPRRPQASVADFRRIYVEMAAMGMLATRLEEAKKRGEARYLMAAGATLPLVRAADAVGFVAAVRPDQISEGFEDLLAELERVRRFGFTQGELDRVNQTLLTRMRSAAVEERAGKEDSRTLADELVRHFLTQEGAPGRAVEYEIAKRFAETARPEEMTAVIRDVLGADDLLVGVLTAPGKRVPGEKRLLGLFDQLPARKLTAYADTPSNQPIMARQPEPGTIEEEKVHADIGVTEWTLSNGARVLLKPTDFKKDEVMLTAFSPGGTSLLPLPRVKKTLSAASVVSAGGLGGLDAIALQKALAGHDVFVSPYIGEYDEGVRAGSGADDVESMLQLVNLTFTAPRKDERAFDVWREAALTSAKLADNDPGARFQRKVDAFLNQGNPRFVPQANARVIRGIDLDAAMHLYSERLQDADDFTFVIVGSFDVAAIEPLVLRYLGSLPKSDRSESFELHEWKVPERRRRLVVKDGTAQRADLTVAFFQNVDADGVRRDRKSQVALDLFMDTLQDRLLELLREDMGATYSVSARASRLNRYSIIDATVQFSVDPARAARLEKAALADIAKAVSDGVSAERFEKVKVGAVKSLETRLQNNAFWTDELVAALENGWGLDSIAKDEALLQAVTVEDANAAARRFIDSDKPTVLIHLPRHVRRGD